MKLKSLLILPLILSPSILANTIGNVVVSTGFQQIEVTEFIEDYEKPIFSGVYIKGEIEFVQEFVVRLNYFTTEDMLDYQENIIPEGVFTYDGEELSLDVNLLVDLEFNQMDIGLHRQFIISDRFLITSGIDYVTGEIVTSSHGSLIGYIHGSDGSKTKMSPSQIGAFEDYLGFDSEEFESDVIALNYKGFALSADLQYFFNDDFSIVAGYKIESLSLESPDGEGEEGDNKIANIGINYSLTDYLSLNLNYKSLDEESRTLMGISYLFY